MSAILICLVLSSVSSGRAGAFTLVHHGRSSHVIVLSNNASPSERHAAKEFQRFVKQISGATLPVVTEARGYKRMVVIGACNTQRRLAPGLDINGMGDEGFAITTVGPHLIIAGGRLRGTMYGVYTFLEDILGCRWYTSTVSIIPKNPTILLKSLTITQKPSFEYREPFYSDARDADWAARNKTNGSNSRLDETRGGKVTYIRFCHTFESLVPPDKYLASHPEYYAFVNGGRWGGQFDGQLCLTNPDVLKIAIETVMQWIAENPTGKIVSVTQNDNFNYCRCEKCQAVDAVEGSPSGTTLRFANAIADEVAKKYPYILIDTFAYQYTEKPPKITKPRPNVRVRLCPINNCQHHDYQTCPRNKQFMENLRGWGAITNRLYIWHYNTNFANYLLPLPDLDEMASNIRLYKRSGVVGVFFLGTYTAGNGPHGGGGWMDDLKAYMLAKLAWNSKADAKAIREDFLRGYFGKAAKPIGEYLDLLHDRVRRDNIHGTVFDLVEHTAFLTDDIMTKSNHLFDKAEALASGEGQRRRVRHARLSLRYVEVYRQCRKAETGAADEKKSALSALERFQADCETDGIERVSETGSLKDWCAKLAKPLR